MQKRITNKKIAKLLRVSEATVSLVINNKPGVSPTTRQAVWDCLKNSVPNEEFDGASKTIACIAYKNFDFDLNNPGFSYFGETLSNECQKSNWFVSSMFIGRNNFDVNLLNSYDGIIFYGIQFLREDIEYLQKLKKPFVICETGFFSNRYDTVISNSQSIASTLIAYLQEKGHTRIGYIRGNQPLHLFQALFECMNRQLEGTNITIDPDWIFSIDPTSVESSKSYFTNITAKEMPSFEKMPTLFIADNDLLAIGVVKALMELGIPVPEKVSVLGVGDLPISGLVDPPLTTVDTAHKYSALYALGILRERMKQKTEDFIKIEYGNHHIVERGTVKNLIKG